MRILTLALVVSVVASAWAAPFVDDFSTNTTGSYTMDKIYGSGTSSMSWQPGGFMQLSSPSPTTVEGWYPDGVTRGSHDAIAMTIDGMTTTAGTGWRGAGLVVSDARSVNLWTTHHYRFALERESGAATTYFPRVRTTNLSTLYSGEGSIEYGPSDLPKTLAIARDGDAYTFLVDGNEVFRHTPDPTVQGFGPEDPLPHFGFTNASAGGTSLTSNVDDFRAAPQPSARQPYIWDTFTIASPHRDVGDPVAGTKPDMVNAPGGTWANYGGAGVTIGTTLDPNGSADNTVSGTHGACIANTSATRYRIQGEVKVPAPGGTWTGLHVGSATDYDTCFQLRDASGSTQDIYVYRGGIKAGAVIPSFDPNVPHLLQADLDLTDPGHVKAWMWLDGLLLIDPVDIGSGVDDSHVGFWMNTANGSVDDFAVVPLQTASSAIPPWAFVADKFAITGSRPKGSAIAGSSPDTVNQGGHSYNNFNGGGLTLGGLNDATTPAASDRGATIQNVPNTRFRVQADVLTPPGDDGDPAINSRWAGLFLSPSASTLDGASQTSIQLRNNGHLYVYQGGYVAQTTISGFDGAVPHQLRADVDSEAGTVSVSVDGVLRLPGVEVPNLAPANAVYVGYWGRHQGARIDNFAIANTHSLTPIPRDAYIGDTFAATASRPVGSAIAGSTPDTANATGDTWHRVGSQDATLAAPDEAITPAGSSDCGASIRNVNLLRYRLQGDLLPPQTGNDWAGLFFSPDADASPSTAFQLCTSGEAYVYQTTEGYLMGRTTVRDFDSTVRHAVQVDIDAASQQARVYIDGNSVFSGPVALPNAALTSAGVGDEYVGFWGRTQGARADNFAVAPTWSHMACDDPHRAWGSGGGTQPDGNWSYQYRHQADSHMFYSSYATTMENFSGTDTWSSNAGWSVQAQASVQHLPGGVTRLNLGPGTASSGDNVVPALVWTVPDDIDMYATAVLQGSYQLGASVGSNPFAIWLWRKDFSDQVACLFDVSGSGATGTFDVSATNLVPGDKFLFLHANSGNPAESYCDLWDVRVCYSVPEPASLALLSAGAAMALLRRRKQG